MHIAANFIKNNTYLYFNNNDPIICKNNYQYPILNKNQYNKIVCIISDTNSYDNIIINDTDKHSLSINTLWKTKNLTKSKDHILNKNILVPSMDNIKLFNKNADTNNINCMCIDETHIQDLPIIKCVIGDIVYSLENWTGFNQVWHTVYQTENSILYGYLYFFATHSYLMCSLVDKNQENYHYTDIDFMSSFNYTNAKYDEYKRIDCIRYKPIFQDYQILSNPEIHQDISLKISTEYNE
jgi:hypothetical protein